MLSWSFAVAALVLVFVPQWLPARARAVVLAVFSLAAVWRLWHVPVWWVLAATLAVWGVGRLLPRLAPRTRSLALGGAILAIVAALAVLRVGAPAATTLTVSASVLGVSYFTLKFIQHLVDAAAGRVEGVGLLPFVGTIFFLPTYPAGPIERTDTLARELEGPVPGWTERVLGVERVIFGLGKQLLLAAPLLDYSGRIFENPSAAARHSLLLALYAFALGLYLDFGAYSDLAIGVARCAGVRVRENFDWPYLQRDLGLLWQRWHMSFTGWLRDFIFLPVTRRALRWTRRPLASQWVGQTVTMIACGLWHGFAWNFVAWGVYHAMALGTLATWRSWRGPPTARTPVGDALSTLVTFHVFMFGLVLFACDLPRAAIVVRRLLGG
jgi:alginate O-acetyltransferase complex protein AlgI